MTIALPDSAIPVLTATISRINASLPDGTEAWTVESWISHRLDEVIAAAESEELSKIKAENASFFDLAASLPSAAQEQVKALVQQLASS